MPTGNHGKSMTAQERNFWKEAFLACPPSLMASPTQLEHQIADRTEFANAAVAAYRHTVTWRQTP